MLDRLESAQRFGAVAFLGVKLGQCRRSAHFAGGANFLDGQFFQRSNRVVGLACRFKSFGLEKQGLFTQLGIVLQRRHLRRRIREILAEQIRLGDGEGGAARVSPFREFRLVVFEGDDRLGIVAGIKISGANGVKNWLNLRRHFHSGDERFEICRGLGVMAGLEFRHRLAVGGRKIAIVLARGRRDRHDRAQRRGKGARAPNGGVHGRAI